MWHDVKEWGGISVWVDEKTNRVIRGLKGEGWNQTFPRPRGGDPFAVKEFRCKDGFSPPTRG